MKPCYFVSWVCLGVLMTSGWAAGADPVVIAHRGASGYLPEHTLEAYALAYGMGADFIEPDLVLTKDGHFIALHDIHLQSTTDVETRYPERHRDDGEWYAADFTLEEVRQLRAHERLKNRFPEEKSAFHVPTLEEVIELVQGLNETTGRNVGIYPELKEPSWHAKQGMPMEEKLLAVLNAYGYTGPESAIFVQCFEPDTLKKLRNELKCALPLIQLISSHKIQASMVTQEGIKEIAAYADGIGPDKSLVEKNPQLVTWAHENQLKVHPYTVRADSLPGGFATVDAEFDALFRECGVDGLFTDFPDLAIAYLKGAGKR